MPSVPLKFIVSFSRQDEKHPVDNILRGDQTKRWLSPPGEKGGALEAEFQLEKSCRISHLDIGTIWTFSVEVSVGRSSWPRGRDFTTLLPTCTFMSPQDSRQLPRTNSGIKMRMFKSDDFSESCKDGKFDRLRIRLAQPFRKDVQFGLCVLKVVTDDRDATSTTTTQSSGLQAFKEKHSGESSGSSAVKTDIQKHFFGNKVQQKSPENALRSQLAKMEKSSIVSEENSSCVTSPRSGQMSRNAQLVMAAVGKSKQFLPRPLDGDAVQGSPQVMGSLSARKRKLLPSIDEEMKRFMDGLNVAALDLDNVKISDLRHKFEKVKCRKLTKEERKTFIGLVKDFIQKVYCDDKEPEASDGRASFETPAEVPVPPCNPPVSPSRSPLAAKPGTTNNPPPPNHAVKPPPKKKARKLSAGAQNRISQLMSDTETDGESPAGSNKGARAQEQTTVTNVGFISTARGRASSTAASPAGRKRLKIDASPRNVTAGVWLSKQDGVGGSPGGRGRARGTGQTPRGGGGQTPRGGGGQTPRTGRGRGSVPGGRQPQQKTPENNYQSLNMYSSPKASISSPDSVDLAVCPICSGRFHALEIENHASSCGILISSDSEPEDNYRSYGNAAVTDVVAMDKCPLCCRSYPLSVLPYHADACAGNM